MPPELTPRPGAKLPPKLEQLGATEKAAMAEIEEITRDQANALNALATSSMRTAEMCEIMAETLEDIKDILVKVCQGTGMPLPKRIQEQIERVSRTSGGKRDRLRDERAALREEGELARKLATSAIQALTTSVNAKASAAMQDSGTSTGNIIVSRDEDTGALVYSRKYTPVATAAPVSQGNNLPPWLLPAGVGLAALLALKG